MASMAYQLQWNGLDVWTLMEDLYPPVENSSG